MLKLICTLHLGLLLWVNTGCQNNEKTVATLKHQRIDSLFNERHNQDLFHGGVVITQQGQTIYENYFGLADRGWNIPVNKHTKFDIASVNKSIIAALVLKAVEEGKLNLEDTLIDLLADFSYEGTFHHAITLHHMLTHSAGLPDYDGVAEELKMNQFLRFKRQHFTNEAYVNFISKLAPISPPGQQFYYSNFAYHLLSIILEETYQKSFNVILEEQLTRPLGFKNTVSEMDNAVGIPNLAKGYAYNEELGRWQQNQFIDLSLGRRVFSTASDLNRWAQTMDNPGWLTAESLALMQQNHLAKIDTNHSYGYGWVVVNDESKSSMVDLNITDPYLIHGGSTEGYKAMLVNINNGAYVISFLSNVGNRTQEIKLAQEITTILMN